MKSILSFFVILSVLTGTVLAEEKPELIFHASFDKYNAHADFAKGDPKSNLTTSLELRSTKGISKSALLLEKGETCNYPVKGNLDMNAGTISFWLTPLNWDWTTKRFTNLFSVSAGTVKNPQKNRFNMSIYVPGPYCGGGGVGFYCQFGIRKHTGFRQFYVGAPLKWKPGEWHKIDCAWDSKNMKLYIDGALKKSVSLPDVKFPLLLNRRFSLTQIWTGKKRRTHNPGDRNIIDEVKIYKGILSDADIKKNYLADMEKLSGPTVIPEAIVPLRTNALIIDGKLDDPAWKKAVSFPVMMGVDGFASPKASLAFLTWDKRNLYIGMSSKQVGKPKTTCAAHDGKLWEDDSFEIIITPPGHKDYYQFIINSRGVVFDTKHKIKKWNCSGLKVKGNVAKGSWSIEAAIPFASLGATPKAGDEWKANLCRNRARPAPEKPFYTSWIASPSGFVNSHGILRLSEAGTGLQLGGPGNPATGLFAFACRNAAGKPAIIEFNAKSDNGKTISETANLAPGKVINKDISIAGLQDTRITVTAKDQAGKKLLLLPLHVFVREPIAVEYVPYVLKKYCLLEIDLSNLPEEWYKKINKSGADLKVEAIQPDGKKLTKDFQVKKIKQVFKLPLDWQDGKYTFKYTISSPGMAPVACTGTLVKPPTPWLTAKSGVTTRVLKPWTPMQYKGNGIISCWGRSYKINGPLLDSVVNQKREQLANPISLVLATNKGSAPLKVKNNKFILRRKDRAEWTGSGRFGSLGGSAEWKSFAEYDGLVSSELTLIPPKDGWNIKSLVMTIPLRQDLAKYIRKPKRVKWNGKTWKNGFTPYIWIGTEDEGFCWFFDSDMNWNSKTGEKPISVTVSPDKTTATIRIVSKPAKVTKSMKYIFGFMASPVKPLMENWRNVKMNTSPLKGRNMNGWCTTFSTRQGILDVAKPKEFEKFCREMINEGNGVKLFLYAGACCAPDSNPTWNFFRKRWENPYYGGFYNMRTPKRRLNDGTGIYNLIGVYEGSGWVDYLTWLGEQTFKKHPVNSVYTDMDRANMPYNNPYAGTGYRNDAFGKSGATYEILPRREFYKRLLTICRNAKKGIGMGMRMAHAHDELVLPYHSFNDMFYPGENYTHKLYKNPWFYVDTLDPAAWRCELSSRASGINHVLLPEFVRGTRKKADRFRPELAESLLTVGLLNDVVIGGAYCERGAMSNFWKLIDKAGITDPKAKAICYWEKNSPVKTSQPESGAAVYTSPKGVAVAVGNLGPKTREIKLTANLKKLDLKGKAVATDLRTGKQYPLINNIFTVPVKARNYTIVMLTKADK